MIYIFAGTNAPDFVNQTPLGAGTYTVDFDPTFKGKYSSTTQEPVVLCGGAIADPSKLKAVLDSTTNYVISLPMPDGYSTYFDSNFQWDGCSESRVSSAHITAGVQPINFTTLRALHYGVKVVPGSLTQAGTKKDVIETTDPSGKFPGGISIVMGEPPPIQDDMKCDHVSLESVKERNGLWSLNQYARFPMELDLQGHQSYHYGFKDRSDDDPNIHPMHAAGSADCHTCQMSINSAIPGAIIPTTVGLN